MNTDALPGHGALDPDATATSAHDARVDAPVHPLWLRITHWLNAVAVTLMVLSGWRIYDASPLFDFRFPDEITLGGWLAGALQWHFAAMWLLFFNGLLYLVLNVASGRARRRLLPVTPKAVLADARAALHGTLAHDDPRHYNAVQKAAYLGAVLLLVTLVASGLVLWKSVQFPLLRTVLGGYEGARLVHFFAMGGIVLFVVVHVVMALRVPQSLRTMFGAR
jgi:thiosulfate reductase cytochrome b subunit